MSGSPNGKAQLRREALARRDAMGEAARREASLAVAERLGEVRWSFRPLIVAGFLPIRSEVDPRPLMRVFADRGAQLCVPAIVGDLLEFRELVPDAPLVPQGFGTKAPGEGAAVLCPTLMLVPLAAFDRRLHRIGYGRGFYDRAIAELRPLATVGLAFAVQEIEAVPDEPHDVALDFLVTESEVLRRA